MQKLMLSYVISILILNNSLYASEPIQSMLATIEKVPCYLSHLQGKEVVLEDASKKLGIQLVHLVMLGERSHSANPIANRYLKHRHPHDSRKIWWGFVDNQSYCLHDSWIHIKGIKLKLVKDNSWEHVKKTTRHLRHHSYTEQKSKQASSKFDRKRGSLLPRYNNQSSEFD